MIVEVKEAGAAAEEVTGGGFSRFAGELR